MVLPSAGALIRQSGKQAEIRLPDQPGKIRVFAYAWDGRGSAATVNLPILVRERSRVDYPKPEKPAEVSKFGSRIQHTMGLLATSTPEHRNRVRIIFNGQSITKQGWWRQVADFLRDHFPHADLEIENLAIGGYSSQYLVRTLPHDVYPFYPDLVVFHVYGPEKEHEEIIAGIRRHTTAEIAIQTDHPVWVEEREAAADEEQSRRRRNLERRSGEFLPKIADRYDCELIDIHRPWQQYLKDRGLRARDLLRDAVHLNDHGNFLMAELLKPYLRHDPSFREDDRQGLVRTYDVGGDLEWEDGRLILEFDGNRVDALAASGAPGAKARILIDGKPPSEFPELYVHTRPTEAWGADWTSINRVSWRTPLLVDEWRLRITEVSEDASFFRFELQGSKTGPDGSGTSGERFVSNSGRVVIEPEDWALQRAYNLSKRSMPPNFAVSWQVIPQFVDVYEAPRIEDPAREYSTILAQGLSNAKHRLELIALTPTAPAIGRIRVFRPPLR